MRLRAAFFPSLLVAVIGCGASTDETPPDTSVEPPDPTANWPTIISADWTIPAGTEGQVCARRTMEEDMWIAGFAARAPVGSHHAVLTVGVPDAPDGVAPCRADTLFPVVAFGAGPGTKPLEFPPGVATKIPKGGQLLFNLHLSNSSEDELAGTSAVRVLTIPESEVIERAEQFAAGTQRVQIPARTTTTHTGYCTMRSDLTLVAVSPHMHSLGRHEKVVAETASGEITLLDTPYAFGEETYRVLDSVKVTNGDKLRVECTHENTTDALVTFGPTTQNEMCMASFYRYPIGGSAACMDN